MKLSARNQLKGKVVEVTKGATTSHVRIEIGQGFIITSSITNEEVADLGLHYAVGKLVLFSGQAGLASGEPALRDPKFSKIAIANPLTAPYGRQQSRR